MITDVAHRQSKIRHFALIACISAVYLAFAISTASHYGITWDEAGASWYVAERNLNYALSLDGTWLDFDLPLITSLDSDHPRVIHLANPLKVQLFGNLLSVIGCRLFYSSLGIIGAPEAHHLPNFLLVAGILAAIFFFTRDKFGLLAATVATFSVAAQPRFWAHTHFNTKDLPYACIMAFTLLVARRAIIYRNTRWIAAASVLMGLAGATKPNAALIPLIIVSWYLLSLKEIRGIPAPRTDREGEKQKTYFVAFLVLAPFIAMVAFVAVWPHLWYDISGIGKFVNHYLALSGKGEPGIRWDTLLLFLSVQPPAILLFGGVGIVAAVRNILRGNNREVHAFLVIWFSLPIIRVMLPRMYNFDGVRHFIEYAVPLGVLTGIGAAKTIEWTAKELEKLSGRLKPTFYALSVTIVALPFIAWMVTMIQIHPYELAYFNFLTGGTPGAQKLWDDATDYWGSSYRDGINWLNENAEPDSLVVVPIAGHIVGTTRHMWLRKDLRLLLPYHQKVTEDHFRTAIKNAGSAPVYAMYITRVGWYNDFIRRVDSEWGQKYTIEVDGAPILKIFKANSKVSPG